MKLMPTSKAFSTHASAAWSPTPPPYVSHEPRPTTETFRSLSPSCLYSMEGILTSTVSAYDAIARLYDPWSRSVAGARAPGSARVRRVRPGPGRRRGDARPLDRARAGDLGARALGHRRAHADARRPRRVRRDDDDALVARAGRMAWVPRTGRVRGRGALRLVRPSPVRRR